MSIVGLDLGDKQASRLNRPRQRAGQGKSAEIMKRVKIGG